MCARTDCVHVAAAGLPRCGVPPWQALEVVVLSYTGVTEAGAARLAAARPKLVVKASRKPSRGSGGW